MPIEIKDGKITKVSFSSDNEISSIAPSLINAQDWYPKKGLSVITGINGIGKSELLKFLHKKINNNMAIYIPSDSTLQLKTSFNNILRNSAASIILLDEPDNHLDPKLCQAFMSTVYDVSEHAQIIMTTHSITTLILSAYEDSIFTMEQNGQGIIQISQTRHFLTTLRLKSGAFSRAFLENGKITKVSFGQDDETSSIAPSFINAQDWSPNDGLSIVTGINGIGKSKLLKLLHKKVNNNMLIYIQDDFTPQFKNIVIFKDMSNSFLDKYKKGKNAFLRNKDDNNHYDSYLKGKILKSLNKLFDDVINADLDNDLCARVESLIAMEPIFFGSEIATSFDVMSILNSIVVAYNSKKTLIQNMVTIRGLVAEFQESQSNQGVIFKDHDELINAYKSHLMEKVWGSNVGPIDEINKALAAGFKHEVRYNSKIQFWTKKTNGKDPIEIHPEFLSSGEKMVLSILACKYCQFGPSLEDNRGDSAASIILLDEPDKHLDPKLCQVFMSTVHDMSEHTQIIMTTHRIDTIALAPKDSIFTIEQDTNGIAQIVPTHPLLAMFRLTTNLREFTNHHHVVYTESRNDALFYEGVYRTLREYCNDLRENKEIADWQVPGSSLAYLLSRRSQFSFMSVSAEKDGSGGCAKVIEYIASDITAFKNLERGDYKKSATSIKKMDTIIYSDFRLSSPYGILDNDFGKAYKFEIIGAAELQKKYPLSEDNNELCKELGKKRAIILKRHSLENYIFDPFILCSTLTYQELNTFITKISMPDNYKDQMREGLQKITSDLKKRPFTQDDSKCILEQYYSIFAYNKKYIDTIGKRSKATTDKLDLLKQDITTVGKTCAELLRLIDQEAINLGNDKYEEIVEKLSRIATKDRCPDLRNKFAEVLKKNNKNKNLSAHGEQTNSNSQKTIPDAPNAIVTQGLESDVLPFYKDANKDSYFIIIDGKTLVGASYPTEITNNRGHDLGMYLFYGWDRVGDGYVTIAKEITDIVVERIYSNSLNFIPLDLAQTLFQLNQNLRNHVRKVLKPKQEKKTWTKKLESLEKNHRSVVTSNDESKGEDSTANESKKILEEIDNHDNNRVIVKKIGVMNGITMRVRNFYKTIDDGNCGFRALLGEDYLHDHNALNRKGVLDLLKEHLRDEQIRKLIAIDIEARYQEWIASGSDDDIPGPLSVYMRSLRILSESGNTPNFQNYMSETIKHFVQQDHIIILYLDNYLIEPHYWPHLQGSLLAFAKIMTIKVHAWIEEGDKLRYQDDLSQNWQWNTEAHIILNEARNHFSRIEMERIDSNQNNQNEAESSDNSNVPPLCIDSSIYDSNYSEAFDELAVNLQLIGTEISHNAISSVNYIMDNIYGKYDNTDNYKAPLMIEDESYSNSQSNAKTSINFNDLLYKSTISFKSLDFMIDTFRFINQPNVQNTQQLLRDVVHLQSIFEGNNMYSMALSVIDISHQLSKGEVQEAVIQAIISISYMALPTVISFTGIPYIGFAYGSLMAGYTGYHAVNNAYSLYSEYNTAEWQLKSAVAYKDLYEALSNSPLQYTYDFASNAKWYEIKANSIKLEIEKTQIKQYLEEKGEFGEKLYDYIHAPMLEEKYNLLNKIISGELTEELAKTLKAKHISMTIGEQHYEHCMEVKNDVTILTTEQYYCYNEEQQILDHIAITGGSSIEIMEHL